MFIRPELALPYDVGIVGSAPRLLGAGAGAQIDSHDAVVRFNFALTAGYEQDVGSRTTLRFVGKRPEGDSEARQKGVTTLASGDEPVLVKLKHLTAVQAMAPHRRYVVWKRWGEFRRGAQAFLAEHVDAGLAAELPNFRSGLMLSLLFLMSSDCACRIHLYGFDESSGDASAGGHYFEAHSIARIGEIHTDLEIEYEVLRRLARRSLVVIH